MSAIYKVWMQVERIDHENDEYETFDAREVDVASFLTEDEAFAFVQTIEDRYHGNRVGGEAEMMPEFKPIAPPDNPEHFI